MFSSVGLFSSILKTPTRSDEGTRGTGTVGFFVVCRLFCYYCYVDVKTKGQLLVDIRQCPTSLFTPGVQRTEVIRTSHFSDQYGNTLVVHRPSFLAVRFGHSCSQGQRVRLPPDRRVSLVQFVHLIRERQVFCFRKILSRLMQASPFFCVYLYQVDYHGVYERVRASQVGIRVHDPGFQARLL